MKDFYFVILGSETDSTNTQMTERLLELGDVRKLMKNFYLLKISEQDVDMRIYIRDKVTGDEKSPVFVIRVTDKLSSAWCMPKENSEYLKKMIKEELHGSVE